MLLMTPELDVESLKLGQVSVNREAFDLDLEINRGFQAYSVELVRLALLILAGLAAVWLRLYLPSEGARRPVGFSTSLWFLLAFASTALSAGAALLHRYTSADSLAYHLTALRRRARNRPARDARPSDVVLARFDEKARDRRFRWSYVLLRLSAALLFLGLVLFCVSVATLMW